jgi:hypothetical protein
MDKHIFRPWDSMKDHNLEARDSRLSNTITEVSDSRTVRRTSNWSRSISSRSGRRYSVMTGHLDPSQSKKCPLSLLVICQTEAYASPSSIKKSLSLLFTRQIEAYAPLFPTKEPPSLRLSTLRPGLSVLLWSAPRRWRIFDQLSVHWRSRNVFFRVYLSTEVVLYRRNSHIPGRIKTVLVDIWFSAFPRAPTAPSRDPYFRFTFNGSDLTKTIKIEIPTKCIHCCIKASRQLIASPPSDWMRETGHYIPQSNGRPARRAGWIYERKKRPCFHMGNPSRWTVFMNPVWRDRRSFPLYTQISLQSAKPIEADRHLL